MSSFLKPNDKRAATIRKRVLSGLVALLAASPLMADKIFVATKTGGKIGSLEFKNEDILQFDTVKNEWSILFDGSDVGLAEERIDGFHVAEDYVLLSLVGAAKLNIGGEKIRIHGSDIVRFNWDPGSSPGDSDTKGTFELFFDGSDVGVKRNIDALALDQEGRLVFSLNGKNKLPQAQGQFFQTYRQDLVRFIGNTGPETNGYFELLFDGRKAGLNRVAEDIDGANLGGEFLYLTTRGNFNVGGVTGRNEDILRCDFPAAPIVSLPVHICSNPQVIFNGSDAGLVLEKLQDIQIVSSIDVALSPSTVAENKPATTAVGTFATSNTDAADTIKYALIAGAGDTDNALFQVSGNQLQTTASFDFEAKSSYSIRVRSEVSDGRFFEKQFTITVQNANDAPTNLELSSASVNENQGLDTIVGSFTTADPDSGDTHTYTLVGGDGDTDNAAFKFVGDQLETAAVFDFETKNSYSIRVRSTDSGGLTFEKSLTISVGNGADAPTDIAVTADSVAENKPSGTVVGSLSSADPDSGDTHTYTLVAGAGDTDNAAFQISGTQLKTAAVFDFETKNSYSIRVRSTDSGGRSFEKTLTVTVTDVNDRPSVTAGGILNYNENDPATAVDPGLIVADVDSANLAGATVSISGNFHSGQDMLEFSAQNGITGSYDSGTGILTLTGPATLANYQAALRDVKYVNTSDNPNTAPRTVTWTVNDGAANSAGVTSTITITPINDAPVINSQRDLNLSISEDTPREIVLADLNVTDPDNTYPSGFSLIVGDGTNYTHTGNTIIPAANFIGSLTVPVMVNDGAANSNSFNLTVTVTAVNDTPVVIPTTFSLSENGLNGSVVGTIATSDVDLPAQTLTYAITAGNTGGAFAIDPSSGQITVTNGSALDFETTPSYLLTVTATDNGIPNLSGSATITVNLTNVNEAPTAVDDTATVDEEGTVTALTTPLLATRVTVNDSDPDAGNPLFVTTTPVAGPAHASAFTLNDDGSFSYTHDGSETTTDSFVYELCDSEPLCDTATVTITINPVNDAPVIANLAGDTLAYSQNEPARVIDQDDNAGASDVDSTDFDTGTLTVSLVNGVVDEDELGIRHQGDAAGQIGIDGTNVNYAGVAIGTFIGGNGGEDLVVTFNTNANAEAVSALLRNITYRNSNALSPDLNNRTARFVLTDGDGATSLDADAIITVSPNAKPELTAGGGSPSFTEDGGAVVVDSGLTVTDANDTELESATVTIGNLLDTGNETLAANTAGSSITASYSAPTLTLTGTDTVAHYQQVLRSVTYNNASQNPDLTVRNITFKVNDGSTDSDTVTTNLTAVSVNDAPSLTASTPPTVLEDTGLQTVNNWATFNAGAAEESGQTVVGYTVSNVSNPALFNTPPAVAADGTLTYTPAGNVNGTSTFDVVVKDNGGIGNGGVDTSTAQTFTITVDPVNDAPSFTKGSDPAVNEDAGLVTINGWATSIAAGPGETGQAVSFVIDSNDNPSLFSVGPTITSNGTLTFTPAPNMNGVAHISLHAQDDGGTANGGDNTSDTVNFTITVNAVNDPPQVTAPGPFTATGNVSVSVPAPGLLTTVSDPADGAGAQPFTVENASYTSAQGGNVTVNTSTGAFIYNPPPGYEGSDSFTYKVCDSGVPASVCTSATVSFTVSGMVWFIDNTAAAGGDGRLSNPFNTLAAFQVVNDGSGNHPAAGDNIFLYESASAYIGPVTLLNNQKLLGQDATAALATMAGVTLAPNSAALPATNSANGTIVSITSASDAIRISNTASNTLRGFTIGNVTSTGTGINMNAGATSFGTLTVTDTAINTNGRALNLTGGTLNATFTGITSTGGANNINLTGIAGTSNFGSGALSGASGTAFNLDGGAGSITYGGTVTNTAAARLVNIVNKSAGGVTLSGNLSGTGSSTGINVKDNTTNGTIAFSGASKVLTTGANAAVTLDNNDSATINFSGGGLAVTTSSGAAFNASNGAAAINVTGSNNTLSSTTGSALNVANTTIGTSGLNFKSINVDGNDLLPVNGIALNNTGSNGGLTVTGTGAAGSGGTIRDTFGDGISLTSTERFTIAGMNITSNLGNGIGGTTVNGFDLDQVSITENGDSAADDDSGIDLVNLTGSAAAGLRPTRITNSTISNNFEFELQITNTAGTLTDLQMSGNAISSNTSAAGHGNLFNFLGTGGGTASMKLTLTSGSFTGNAPFTGTGVQCDHSGTSGTMICNISGATFTNNNVGPQASVAGGAQVVFDFNGNTVTGNRSHGINVFADANPPFTKSLIGRIQNNIVGTLGVANSGANLGNGIRIQNEGAVPVTLLISGNTVQEVTSFPGINANIGLAGIATGGEVTNLTIINNTVREMDGSRAVVVQDNQTTAPDFPGICVDMSGNSFSNIAGQAGDGSFVRLRELNGVFNVRQLAPSASAVVNELDDANSGNDPTGTKYAIGGTPQFNSGACTQP